MRYGQMKKNRLKIKRVKALTIVKTQFKDFSCSELFSQISKEKRVSGTGSYT
jgi:hypothetical protein